MLNYDDPENEYSTVYNPMKNVQTLPQQLGNQAVNLAGGGNLDEAFAKAKQELANAKKPIEKEGQPLWKTLGEIALSAIPGFASTYFPTKEKTATERVTQKASELLANGSFTNPNELAFHLQTIMPQSYKNANTAEVLRNINQQMNSVYEVSENYYKDRAIRAKDNYNAWSNNQTTEDVNGNRTYQYYNDYLSKNNIPVVNSTNGQIVNLDGYSKLMKEAIKNKTPMEWINAKFNVVEPGMSDEDKLRAKLKIQKDALEEQLKIRAKYEKQTPVVNTSGGTGDDSKLLNDSEVILDKQVNWDNLVNDINSKVVKLPEGTMIDQINSADLAEARVDWLKKRKTGKAEWYKKMKSILTNYGLKDMSEEEKAAARSTTKGGIKQYLKMKTSE